ncbi:MAG: UDP-2,3-diacylglucosamine diphosphatase [Halofilum sp. (in: g-proteobacteria)]|nr:UDP-2,3-diacylglucosamine diphosphatase [Halofilum sp. (in: g-proteobacteria)]
MNRRGPTTLASLLREAAASDQPDPIATPRRPARGAPATTAREASRAGLRAVWISDLHLGTPGARAEALSDFLKHHRCERLYLVGDVIDGWRLRSRIYWPQAHTDVIRRVLTKARRGCRVYLVTGNHDEFLRRYGEIELGNITLCDRTEHLAADGRRLLVIHGDQYDSVVQGHRWLAFLGDRGYELLLWFNRWFNRFRETFGYGYWSLSAHVKRRVKKAVSYISRFEDAVAWDCRRRGFHGVVCGHIHHAEIRDIGGVTYYNCGDWVESCTALVEHHDGRMEIRRWATIGHGDPSPTTAVEDSAQAPRA